MSAFAEIDIVAPRPAVWAILVDIGSWPMWNPAIRQSVRDRDLEVGSKFRFSTEIGTLKCKVTVLDSSGSFSWKGRVLALGERQTWQLRPTDTGTHVMVQAEMTGPVAHLFRQRLTERLQRVVDSVLQLLRLEAEVRTTEAAEVAARTVVAEGRTHD